jgi:hypothetical protein
MSLEEHPGYFGLTSKGVIAIHADWPTYPFEHGWGEALLAFGSLPKSTHFIQIDDIDRCVLFVAGSTSTGQDFFNYRLSHVAAWYEDLVALVNKSYVVGVNLIRECDAELYRWDRFNSCFVENETGNLVPLNLPRPEFDCDLSSNETSVPVCSPFGLQVTDLGFDALNAFLASEFAHAPREFLACVEPIIGINKNDTAVREACVLLESAMRQRLGSIQFGQKLVEEYCGHLLERGAIAALVKPFQAELKNAFRYIRNDYMHNLRPLELNESRALLMRLARLYSIITTTEIEPA